MRQLPRFVLRRFRHPEVAHAFSVEHPGDTAAGGRSRQVVREGCTQDLFNRELSLGCGAEAEQQYTHKNACQGE